MTAVTAVDRVDSYCQPAVNCCQLLSACCQPTVNRSGRFRKRVKGEPRLACGALTARGTPREAAPPRRRALPVLALRVCTCLRLPAGRRRARIGKIGTAVPGRRPGPGPGSPAEGQDQRGPGTAVPGRRPGPGRTGTPVPGQRPGPGLRSSYRREDRRVTEGTVCGLDPLLANKP